MESGPADIPVVNIVKVKRPRKVSASRYKHALARDILQRDGQAFNLEALNRTASTMIEIISSDPEIAKAAEKWADERNVDKIITRERAITMLKKSAQEIQFELSKLGVTSIFTGIADGRTFEFKNGPLIKDIDKFLSDGAVRFHLPTILEAVVARKNSQLILGYVGHVTQELKKGKAKSRK